MAQVHVEREQIAQAPWERDDPLAHGDVGEDVVHEVRGGFGYAASATGRAEALALAGEGNQERSGLSEWHRP